MNADRIHYATVSRQNQMFDEFINPSVCHTGALRSHVPSQILRLCPEIMRLQMHQHHYKE